MESNEWQNHQLKYLQITLTPADSVLDDNSISPLKSSAATRKAIVPICITILPLLANEYAIKTGADPIDCPTHLPASNIVVSQHPGFILPTYQPSVHRTRGVTRHCGIGSSVIRSLEYCSCGI